MVWDTIDSLTTLSASTPQTTFTSHFNSGSAATQDLALPLIALQYHEVRVNIDFESEQNLICYKGAMDGSVVNARYVYHHAGSL